MKIALIVIFSILGVLLLLFIIAIITMYFLIYHRPSKRHPNDMNILKTKMYRDYEERIKDLINNLMSISYKDIYIESFDEKTLHGKLYENKQSKKVAIMCHGYKGTPYRDFSGGASEFIKMGYNVILIDERAHGKSEGHSITFGIKERKDVLSWLEFAQKRFGLDYKYVLVGISMGGATVLNLADKVDSNIKIIADCPYARIKELFIYDIKMLKLPVFIFYPLLRLTGILFAHVDIAKFDNYQAINNTTNKVLIIHGNKDSVVPYTLSQKLYETYPDKIQYELFDGAEHGVSYLVDDERYRRIVKQFLEK